MLTKKGLYTPAPVSEQRGKIRVECRLRKEDLPPVLRSPVIRAALATAALIVFYLLGVAARQHYGSCIDLRNLSGKTVRQVRVTVEGGGKTYDLPDLEPGDHKRVYVPPAEKSEVTLRIDDGMSKPRDIKVFGHAEPGDCGVAMVQILPQHNTQTDEIHRPVCWKGWLDFL
jgi:hypothetical protein